MCKTGREHENLLFKYLIAPCTDDTSSFCIATIAFSHSAPFRRQLKKTTWEKPMGEAQDPCYFHASSCHKHSSPWLGFQCMPACEEEKNGIFSPLVRREASGKENVKGLLCTTASPPSITPPKVAFQS